MLKLTPDVLRSAYDYLNETDPFVRWNLPEGEEVKFAVIRNKRVQGQYLFYPPVYHEIQISANYIGSTASLMMVMAHEMIHVHEHHSNCYGRGEHSKAFGRWSAQVCKVHGFDLKLF